MVIEKNFAKYREDDRFQYLYALLLYNGNAQQSKCFERGTAIEFITFLKLPWLTSFRRGLSDRGWSRLQTCFRSWRINCRHRIIVSNKNRTLISTNIMFINEKNTKKLLSIVWLSPSATSKKLAQPFSKCKPRFESLHNTMYEYYVDFEVSNVKTWGCFSGWRF